ncbi:unnamed protein product [Rotaria sordida]|uniref:Uncharacterized protein n=1 Tax=Rotaria sordida TaxID=392033 RepID=A0A815WY46_9BILA|nr:unnamed protein product [Rotaria sordida]CAF1550319.1 unnamed protein product [Rotaria sordida]
MANAKIKSDEKDEPVIKEDIGVFQRTTQQISPSTQEKRKRNEDIPVESPRRYIHRSDGNRYATTEMKNNSLSVPFWKNLNHRQSSFQFQTHEIGYFALFNQIDDKECFEDKRYMSVGESDFISERRQSKNINAMLWWILRHKQDIFKNNQFTFDFLS